MNTATISIKTTPETKDKAQKIAQKLGISLSKLMEDYLKQIIRTRGATVTKEEEPSEYLMQSLKESEEDVKTGRVITFNNLEEELRYLDKLIADDKKV